MARILSMGSSSEFKQEEQGENFFKKLWETFQSLDTSIKIFILFILLFTLTVPVVTKQYLDTRQRAAENENITEQVPEVKEPEYVAGEVLIKFKRQPELKIKPELAARASELDKGSVSVDDLEDQTIPSSLRDINRKYKIKTIEKIFKETKAKNMPDISAKNMPDISGGKQNEINLSGIYKLSIKEKVPIGQVIKEINQSQEVEYAEPNYIFYSQQLDPISINDPYYLDSSPSAQERDLSENSGGWNPKWENGSLLDYQWNLKKIKFSEGLAWASSSASTTVAVIDTGVDYNHPDLQGKIWENAGETGLDIQGRDKKTNGIDDDNNGYVDDWRGWDASIYCEIYEYIPETGEHKCNTAHYPDNDPMDDYFIIAEGWKYQSGGGHGTHVAGIIGGKTNNALGISGIAGLNDNIKIMPLRGLGVKGSGYSSQLAELITYAVSNNAKVINMSWGSKSKSQVIADTIDYASSHNVALVAASGNDTTSLPFFPASLPNVISVGATNENDFLTSYSNYGPSIDVVAPGGNSSGVLNPHNLLSLRGYRTDMYCMDGRREWCYWQGEYNSNKHSIEMVGENYYRSAGTSMAAPHVAGLASLLLAKNPNLSSQQIEAIIEYSADDLGDNERDDKYGYGRINIYRALKEFSTDPPPIALISDPYNQEHLYYGTFEIKGTASSDKFQSYRLEYTSVNNPNNWSSNGISLSTASVNGIADGTLGKWDSGTLEGKYFLKLTAVDKEGRERSRQIIVELVNQSLKSGWPIVTGYEAGILLSDPITADLDNDGKKEIIINQSDKIIVYKENGQIMQGWPVSVSSKVCTYTYYCYYRNNAIVVGDVDPAFPGKEIIVNEIGGNYPSITQRIKIIHSDGAIASNIDNAINNGTVADLNGDEKDEVLSVTSDGTQTWALHAYNSQGQEIPGFPINFYQGYGTIQNGMSNTRVGDLDGDNKEDVVIFVSAINSTNDNVLITVSGIGQVLWQKKLHQGYNNYYEPQFVLADLDLDNKKEIIFYDQYNLSQSPWFAYELYVFKGSGENFFTTNPLNLADVSSGTVNIADINNDNYPEILAISNQKIGIIDKTGNINVQNISSQLKIKPGLNMVIGDINGNNLKEFLSTNTVDMLPFGTYPQISNYMLDLYEYANNNFVERNDWPKSIIADAWALGGNGSIKNSILEDIDNDGKAEFVIQYCLKRKNSCYLYVLKNNERIGFFDWPQYLHDERHSGSYSVKSSPSPTPTPTPTPTPLPTRLSLNFYLDGIGFKSRTYDNRNPVIGKRTLTLQVFDLNNSLLLEKTGEVNYLDTSGTFKGIVDLGYTLKTGTYNVKIRMEKYLKKSIKNIQINVNTDNTTSETNLLPGDINLVKDQSGNTIVGDNKVNLTDYQTFYSCLSSTTVACINKADLNSDNRVNLSDYSLLMKNYGKVGD